MSNYQNAASPSTMCSIVIDTLEQYCGQPIFSRTMAERYGVEQAAGNLRDMACDLTEGVAELQGLIRRAIADDRLTPRELDNLAHAEAEAARALEQLTAARRAAETQRPGLKAV